MLERGITELLFTSDGINQLEEKNHYVLENGKDAQTFHTSHSICYIYLTSTCTDIGGNFSSSAKNC